MAPSATTNGAGPSPLRVLFALPGLHRVSRGAEIAFESVASCLAERADCRVTLVGSGEARAGDRYRFLHVPCTPRERFEHWPRFPVFRDHYVYEEFSFARRLWSAVELDQFDATVGCSFPFVNWTLRARRGPGGARHIFVTQNGDWPAHANRREYRLFSCDGLVCTNPEYFERNRSRWPCALIPNGVDPALFAPGEGDRAPFEIPDRAPLALMVSALIPSKNVEEGVRAAARVPDLHLLVVGDGELRERVDGLGKELLGARYRRVTLPRAAMPGAYRCADVFLHMSRVEPSANAYIEALATCLPIVTHDREVTRWTFEDRAVLVDTTDPKAVAEAIRRALALRSPAYAAGCRELVERRFSWRSIAAEYASFIRGITRGV